MENIKEILYKGIESEENVVIGEYADLREQVSQETRVPKLYEIIVEIYHNNIPQRKVAEDFLKNTLTDEFFKSAKVASVANSIVFFDDRYEISLPLSRGKHINIIDTKLQRVPYFHKMTSDWNIKLIELTENFLSSKSFSDFKELNDFHKSNRKPKNFIGKLYNYNSTYKTFNKEKLESLKKEVDLDNQRELENRRLIEKHEIEMNKSLEFCYSLKGLKEWEDCGWVISHFEDNKKLTLDYNKYYNNKEI